MGIEPMPGLGRMGQAPVYYSLFQQVQVWHGVSPGLKESTAPPICFANRFLRRPLRGRAAPGP
ncbi:MAG: hypothetical protein CMH85_10480, partial [Novosphingobium sp.]|nr:hypothetical protein [Novosphingobium sp.]